MNLSKNQLFPVTVYQSNLEDASFLNVYLKSRLYSWRQRERSGIKNGAAVSMGSWHSKNSMQEMQEFQLFTQQIRQCIDEVLIEEGQSKQANPWCVCMAANICDRYGYDQPLEEIENAWCGVYFVQSPVESGGITFLNPGITKDIDDADSRERENSYDVEAGQVFIFPSWLRYKIQQNQSSNRGEEGERISIAFAYSLQRDSSQ